MNNFDVLLGLKLGGGGSSTLVEKTITAHGTYNPADDNADGYSSVTANVPNTYTVADEGKVVDSGALVSQTAKNIDANGLYDTTLNNSVSVDVPNSYTVADEGKVVSGGDLVSQSAYPSTIVANGTYDTTLNNSVTVDVPPTPAETKSVVFYDYDGTVLYSYTPTEFAALTELPANPTHSGLTAQGWNWTLADAKSYVADYKYLNIGQMYVTDDGKTRLYIKITNDTLSPYIEFYCSSDSFSADVDWGDGSEHTTMSGSYPKANHTYTTTGEYVIAIDVISGRLGFYGFSNCLSRLISDGTSDTSTSNYNYHNILYKIELGANIIQTTFNGTSKREEVFSWLFSLKSITMPNYIVGSISSKTFYQCSKLKWLTIPSSVTSISVSAFYDCYSLTSVTIPSSVTSIGNNAFQNCYSLKYIDIDKPTDSISGSPWGANIGLPIYVQIIWHD